MMISIVRKTKHSGGMARRIVRSRHRQTRRRAMHRLSHAIKRRAKARLLRYFSSRSALQPGMGVLSNRLHCPSISVSIGLKLDLYDIFGLPAIQ